MNFDLTPKQSEYFRQVFDENTGKLNDNNFLEAAFFGGFGSGKSFVVALSTALVCKNYPGVEWLYIRGTYKQLEDSVINQFLRSFPSSQWGYIYKKQKREAHFQNGSKLYFRAFDVDGKILSNEYDGASLCQAEELEYDLYLAMIGRLRRRFEGGPHKNMRFLEGNPADGWVKKRFKNDGVPAESFIIESTTFDNPNLPDNYVKTLISEYPESWIRRYVYGEWGNFDELVFNEFKEQIHIVDPIVPPKEFRKAIGMDYGYKNPSAMVWGCVNYDGDIFIYDEFYAAGKIPDELAIENMRHGRMITIIDPSVKSPQADGKTVWSLLQGPDLKYPRINLIEAHKDKKKNILGTNSLLKKNRLFICRNCVNLIQEIRNYKWKRVKLGAQENFTEEVIKKDDHAVDAMMYLLNYLEDLKSESPQQKAFKNSLMAHIIRPENVNKIENLG